MNISMVISSIIGGILIVAIAALNLRMSESSSNNTLYNMTKTRIDLIAEIATYDIRKMGYKAEGGVVIATANEHELSFYADIDNNGFTNLVSWSYDTTATVDWTQNPRDFRLTREVLMEDGSVEETDLSMVVTKFEFEYLDAANEPVDPQTEAPFIRKITLRINTESEAPYGERYIRAAWERTFTPRNLGL